MVPEQKLNKVCSAALTLTNIVRGRISSFQSLNTGAGFIKMNILIRILTSSIQGCPISFVPILGYYGRLALLCIIIGITTEDGQSLVIISSQLIVIYTADFEKHPSDMNCLPAHTIYACQLAPPCENVVYMLTWGCVFCKLHFWDVWIIFIILPIYVPTSDCTLWWNWVACFV